MMTDPNERDSVGKPDDRNRSYANDSELNEDELAGNPTGVAENEEDHSITWDEETGDQNDD